MDRAEKANLEKDLMNNLRELNNIEQNELKIFSAMFISTCKKIKSNKVMLLDDAIINQIKFYGKRKELYSKDIDLIERKYIELMDQIIDLYITWYCAIVNKLQDSYNNQKISITNCKIAIDSQNEVKMAAAEYKIDNYETVIQECKRQLSECKEGMEQRVNQIFYDKGNSLSVKKNNIIQKILNIFIGKNKVKEFVIEPLNIELKQIEESVNRECENIEQETINNIAMIEDGIIQTKNIFTNMVKEYGYNG